MRFDGHPLTKGSPAEALAKAGGKGGRIRTRDLRVGTGCFGQAKLRPYLEPARGFDPRSSGTQSDALPLSYAGVTRLR